jgi:DNA primase catalytic core
MARIIESEIERLNAQVPMQRLAHACGVSLLKSGRSRIGRCPFHEDDQSSLTVMPSKNLWRCLGCGLAGGPVDWVMKFHGVSRRHAVELLRQDAVASVRAASDVRRLKQSTVPRLPAPLSADADDQTLLGQVVDYYAQTLADSPEALEYLKARGIDDSEAVRHFKLGYANRTLGLRLPEKNRQAGEAIRTRLQRLGVFRDSGHEHFNGSLIVPVLDSAGKVTQMYGRKIRDDLRAGTPKHLHLPGPHEGIWNADALAAGGEIILCKGLIDALTFWCAGFRSVTASHGIAGCTDAMLAAFKHHGTQRILIAYRRDAPGERAAGDSMERLLAAGIACARIRFPNGMDANDYARHRPPASRSLGVAIRQAVWMGRDAPEPLPACLPNPGPTVVPDSAPAPPGSPATPGSPPASAGEVMLQFGEGPRTRRYRARGLDKNLAYEILKINLLVSAGQSMYVDTLDLYAAKQRQHYVAQAAAELGLREELIKADLGRLLLHLEAVQDARIQAVLTPAPPAAAQIAAADRHSALTLLRAPDLVERILADFEACGIVGEATNKLAGYLAATSRKLGHPLAVVIQSASGAGKSVLMDAILSMMPDEERIKYSAVTGQSLFYMGETHLQHKILAIVEERGASKASYALKLLQSDGELTIASTGKDPATGNLTTRQYKVTGPVMVFLTTAAIEIDEELLNRCLVLSVDEDREQTRAIHRLQRRKRTLAGLAAQQEKVRLLTLHQNAQRLLRPLAVVNPYADQLTFLDDRTRTRRDHEKYLTLIDAIALLHQHQRTIKTMTVSGSAVEYVEVTAADIARANALAHEVLGRSLDELPPQTRRLLAALHTLVDAKGQALQLPRRDVRFTRAEVRHATGLADTQARIHLERLTSLEYLLVHSGMRGRRYEYELLHDGPAQATGAHLSGLIDADALLQATSTTASSREPMGEFAGPSRPQRGSNAGASRAGESAADALAPTVRAPSPAATRKTHVQSGNGRVLSYPPTPIAAQAA